MASTIDITGLNRSQLIELLSRILCRLLLFDDDGGVAAKPTSLPDSRLLSAKQVAERWSVPETWVRDQARMGKLHSVQLGRYVRFRASDLERFLGDKPEPASLRAATHNDIHHV